MSQTLVLSDSTAGKVRSEPPEFRYRLMDGGFDTAWMHVAGELDIATAPPPERTLRWAEIWARVVLDLRELAFMDCSGMNVIVQASIRASRVGRRPVLVGGRSQVDRVLTPTGASDVLEIVTLDLLEPPVQALVQLAQNDFAA